MSRTTFPAGRIGRRAVPTTARADPHRSPVRQDARRQVHHGMGADHLPVGDRTAAAPWPVAVRWS
ncbi:MAG: hypothetical protein E7G49_06660 [Cutibacterium granulosum]|nr:hypothetical protein [Cutibacterium granulosum]